MKTRPVTVPTQVAAGARASKPAPASRFDDTDDDDDLDDEDDE
jgi:hypothetical protein